MASKTDSPDDTENRVFDVSKPGKSAPDTTSRPVIVGHRTILQDPMVTAKQGETDKTDKPGIVSTTAPTLKPLSDSDKIKVESPPETKPTEKQSTVVVVQDSLPDSDENSDDESDTVEVTKPEPAENTDAKPKEDTSPADTTSDSGNEASSEAGAVTAVADQAEAEKAKVKEDQEAVAKQEAMQNLITNKKYYVAIGEAKRKRNLSLGLVLVIVVLVLVGAYVAIDSGMIKTSVNLPVHLFKTTP